MTDRRDDDLTRYAAEGSPPLPAAETEGYVERGGGRIWYATYGAGPAVVFLHGAIASSDSWSFQVPAVASAGHRVVVIDTRGHGRSTLGTEPLAYETMADDVVAVLDALGIDRASIVGWSDGAIVGLILAMKHADRVTRVFAFAGNMDLSGVADISPSDPLIAKVFPRLAKDYGRVAPNPEAFEHLTQATGALMGCEPNYRAEEIATIGVPVTIGAGERDNIVKREHSEYLARTIPGAALVVLPEVAHFAPLQRPDAFNAALLRFLAWAER
jgi:pimeloyl-ACP methyl ester carboxylesterase